MSRWVHGDVPPLVARPGTGPRCLQRAVRGESTSPQHPGRARAARSRLIAAFALALVFAGTSTVAWSQSDEEKARAQLKELQRDITRINREISTARGRRNTLQEAVKRADLELGQLKRDIAANRADIAATQEELGRLETQRSELETARDAQQERVAQELRAAWQMGGDAPVKVLLNQQDPHAVSRMMTYYRYFLDARNQRLADYRATLTRLDEVQQEIARNREQLEGKRAALAEQQTRVAQAQAERRAAVDSLSRDIASKGSELEQKQRDRTKLEALLKAIEEAVVNLQVPDNYQAFAAAKGKMPWPVTGKPSNRYGSYRNEGKMRWQGLSIPAREGTEVQAIHHGRVVYADWFRGSGLLLIIDHGDGYMSLYAHNQSLLREVGEWVSAGSPISTVGSSGGLDKPALYFEVRHKGKPTDPARWCRR